MRLSRILAVSIAALVACAAWPALAAPIDLSPPALNWAGGITAPAPGQLIGYDANTSDPCIVGSTPDCVLATSVHATGTFDDAAIGTTGSAVPASASLGGINVGGTMRAQTGANPSGVIYATHVDLASVAGATIKTGNGTAAGAVRVAIASDNTAFAVTCALCALASNQAVNADTAALVTLAAGGAGTTNSADQTNLTGRGVQVGVYLTTVTTATVTVNIQGKDAASGQYYTILASTALAISGFTNLTVYPGAATAANASSPQPLPKTWRVQTVVVGASAAVTGTVGASVIN